MKDDLTNKITGSVMAKSGLPLVVKVGDLILKESSVSMLTRI